MTSRNRLLATMPCWIAVHWNILTPESFLILDYCSLFWLWGCSTWSTVRSNIKIISQRIHWSLDPRSSMFSTTLPQNPLEKFSSRIFNASSFIKSNDSYSDLHLDYPPVSCHIKYCRLKFPFWNLFGSLKKATLSFFALLPITFTLVSLLPRPINRGTSFVLQVSPLHALF